MKESIPMAQARTRNGQTQNATPAPTPDLATVLAALTSELADVKQQLKRMSGSQPPEPDRGHVEGVATALPPPVKPRGRDLAEEILELVELHGKLPTTDLIEKTQQSKSAVHNAIGLLEDRGKVVVVRGKRNPDTGRRGPDVVWTADSLQS